MFVVVVIVFFVVPRRLISLSPFFSSSSSSLSSSSKTHLFSIRSTHRSSVDGVWRLIDSSIFSFASLSLSFSSFFLASHYTSNTKICLFLSIKKNIHALFGKHFFCSPSLFPTSTHPSLTHSLRRMISKFRTRERYSVSEAGRQTQKASSVFSSSLFSPLSFFVSYSHIVSHSVDYYKMMDNNSIPIDLRIKRKYDDIDPSKLSAKRKARSHHEYEIPLDLSVKTPVAHSSLHPISAAYPANLPFYDPTNLLVNSSALLYDLFLANLNSYWQHRSTKIDPVTVTPAPILPKAAKPSTIHATRPTKEAFVSKQELYACSCGEKFSNVAHLVSHLKITNHHAQLSSTHDEVAKLVRGQDIWLSRDTNPANQILKCLRCSLSFETLPDLTAHMMKTNHFTQLLPSSSTKPTPSGTAYLQQQQPMSSPTRPFHSSSSTRSTCLICSEQFAREVDLVDHIQHVHQIRFNCTTCGMYFENEALYRDHVFKEMHYRNGKANRNRDYFLQQCKALQKSSKPSKYALTKGETLSMLFSFT